MKELADDIRLFLDTPQVVTHIGYHVLSAGSAPAAHRVLFHIGIKELVGIQVGPVRGKDAHTNPVRRSFGSLDSGNTHPVLS